MSDPVYTGIGSRSTPQEILDHFITIGEVLARLGFTLRSGGADGADAAFEVGCDRGGGKKEIFLPWKRFNNNLSPHFEIPQEAFEIAEDIYGSRWQFLKPSVKRLMARNIQQILGKNLDSPSQCVICWTPDGCLNSAQRSIKTGGTGQAISCAFENDIPVFNLSYHKTAEVIEFLSTAYGEC